MSKRKRDDVTVTSVDGEEGELVTHDDLLEPQEHLSKERELVAEGVKKTQVEDCKHSPANYDIDHNIREIRAIMKMNAEILDRCVKFMTIIDNRVGELCLFNRIAYEVVTARAWGNGTQVITHPIRTTKEFNIIPLSSMPKGLDGIFVSSNMTGEKLNQFIDFEAFFKKCLILHETVLEQFLPILKEHLMSIQVCLGEIDSWVIQEPQKNISFLEDTFFKQMEMPDNNVTLGRHKCSCKTHDPNEICLSCGKKYCDHYDSSHRCNERYHSHSYRNKYFQCEYYQLLKLCNGNGEYKSTFDLTNEKERMRLRKFLEYMAFD